MHNDPGDPARVARKKQDKTFADQQGQANAYAQRTAHIAAGRGGVVGFLLVVGLILLAGWLLFR